MRARLIFAICTLALIALGLASRAWRELLPAFAGEYAGDTIWAAMVYCGFGVLFPGWSIAQRALAALGFSFCIEISQLYHAPWIDAIRANRFAKLVLGDTFVWSDLVCYAVGAMGAAISDRLVRHS